MIFTGVTGGEIVSLLYPLFILSPFCYIIISKESLDGASHLNGRDGIVPSSAASQDGLPDFFPCVRSDGSFVYDADGSGYFGRARLPDVSALAGGTVVWQEERYADRHFCRGSALDRSRPEKSAAVVLSPVFFCRYS